MINFFGFDIFGVELVKPGLFVQGFFFSVALILTVHYGLLIVIHGISGLKKKDVISFLLSVLYVMLACVIFYALTKSNWLFNILLYVWLILYGVILLSRGVFNWYSKSNEIIRKLNRVLEILEKNPR